MTRSVEIPGVRIGMACVHRVQPEYGQKIGSLAECETAVAHPTDKATRAELVQAIAYLSAQVAGYQNSAERNASLAIAQIERVVAEYQRTRGVQ